MWHVKGLYVWRMNCKHINVISLFYIVFLVAINLSFCPSTPAAIWVATSPSCIPLAALRALCGASLMGHVSHYPCYRELSCFCFRFCVKERAEADTGEARRSGNFIRIQAQGSRRKWIPLPLWASSYTACERRPNTTTKTLRSPR